MYKLLLVALTILVLSPTSILAVSDENVTKRRPDKPEAAQIQEIRQERVENRQERRDNIAQNHADRLSKRFSAYYSRLGGIMTRFQARIDLLKKAGKDTSSTQAKLDLAKAKLEEAKTKGEAAIAAFKAIDPAKFSEQKTQAIAARDLATDARQLFADTNVLIKDALKSLKTISSSSQEAL